MASKINAYSAAVASVGTCLGSKGLACPAAFLAYTAMFTKLYEREVECQYSYDLAMHNLAVCEESGSGSSHGPAWIEVEGGY